MTKITYLSEFQRARQRRLIDGDILVRTTKMMIKNIATETGYKNIFTFSEAYKNFFGKSPMTIRKQYNDELLKRNQTQN
jgi:transcriptional regulator GlxA family with amidase domain